MVSRLPTVMGITTTESVIGTIKLYVKKISLYVAHSKHQFRPHDISSTKEKEYITAYYQILMLLCLFK